MMDSPPWWYRERFATPPCRYRDGSVSLVRRYGRVDFPSQRDRNRGPSPQQTVGRGASPRRFKAQGNHEEPSTSQNLGNDVISRALQQISHSFFSEEIESTNLPWRFVKTIFINYDGKSVPVEHVSHYNQSMTISSKNEELVCKIFSLKP